MLNISFSTCSIRCRNTALSTYHKYECRIASALERTQLHRLPLVMASLRGITQKPMEHFQKMSTEGAFDKHDTQHGTQEDFVYKSDDYRSLFNLVTHDEKRSSYDVVTKHIIAAILLTILRATGYFPSDKVDESDVLIGKSVRIITTGWGHEIFTITHIF